MRLIIRTRPQLSNSGLSTSAPTKLLIAKIAMYHPAWPDAEERRQGVAVGEEEGVVEERLPDEEARSTAPCGAGRA